MAQKALPPPPRQRTRPPTPEEDVFPYNRELQEMYGGQLPPDSGERLRFMEGVLQHEDYRPYRHALMFMYRSMGVPIPEIARRMNRGLSTIHRWCKQSKEYFRETYARQDVREIHSERMTRIQQIGEKLMGTLMQRAQTPNEVAAVSAALTQLIKAEDMILKAAGYYEVFNVKGAGDRTDGGERAQEFKRDLIEAFEDDGPMTIDQDDEVQDVEFEED